MSFRTLSSRAFVSSSKGIHLAVLGDTAARLLPEKVIIAVAGMAANLLFEGFQEMLDPPRLIFAFHRIFGDLKGGAKLNVVASVGLHPAKNDDHRGLSH